MSRLLDYDALTGISEIFHYDETNDTFLIETRQDIEPFVEANKRLYNERQERWGDGQRVARIPNVIYDQFLREGKLQDQAYLRRWLNDPDNRVFRTRPGVI
jgi:hypothetical protein